MWDPIEYLATKKQWQELSESPRRNPDFSNYDGLEVKLAVVRPPNYGGGGVRITSSQQAYTFLKKKLEDDPVESFLTLLLDSQHVARGVYVVAKGTDSSVEVHARNVLGAALVSGSTAFIVAHNHPSGDPEPSQEDHMLTQRLREAGEILGIPLLDHLIVGLGKYVSLADRGML